MKVLLYAHSFAPRVGGAETYVMLLARGLAEHPGEEPVVVTATAAGDFDDATLPFRVVRRPGLFTLWRLLGESDVVHLAGPAFLPLLLGLLRRKRIAIEHHGYQAVCPNGLLFYEPSKTACPGHFMARRYGECLRCNAAAVGWWRSATQLLLAFPRRWMCRRAAANVAVTHHVSRRIELPRTKVIYHGVASLPAGPSPRPHPVPCFAYVGRLVSEKGLPLLLQAAGRLKNGREAFRLKFIGDGPERPRLEAMADELALRTQVIFTGFLQRDALQEALENVAAIVMPSIWEETAGLAAIEQMMRGKLVIAADIGGLSEIVDGVGLKFAPGNDESLAACLRWVLEEPDLANQMGEGARQRACQLLSQDRMVGEHLAMYRDLAACGQKSRGANLHPIKSAE